ncbi:amidohydrolase [Roseivirga sp. E12]|uniref:amidohydrolase family protein n=1 Tax=Roseivirga sp. E12 TaxID=2819237 RepID=UPI001ABC0E07|nr:amidohydrolase family protein [Roseivirga sp. E12]MBO3699900.1 amidohydrolase family protein [Roseivirga sp. E12]
MRLDAHQHFWQYDAGRDTWIDKSMVVLKRNFLPDELEKELKNSGIDGCIVVQADQSEEETDYLLELASQNQFIKGVVGWVDLQADNIKDRLAHYVQNKKLKGVRHILQAETPDFMLGDNFTRGIKALSAFNLTYDILILPKHLGAVLELVHRFPRQRFVLDHLAKPEIKDQIFSPWKEELMMLAEMPNVYCKVSGLTTEADWHRWKPQDVHSYLDIAFEAFGTDRLMYGSDWPVCLLAGGYTTAYELLSNYMQSFAEEDKEKVFGLNAQKFYNLE